LDRHFVGSLFLLQFKLSLKLWTRALKKSFHSFSTFTAPKLQKSDTKYFLILSSIGIFTTLHTVTIHCIRREGLVDKAEWTLVAAPRQRKQGNNQ